MAVPILCTAPLFSKVVPFLCDEDLRRLSLTVSPTAEGTAAQGEGAQGPTSKKYYAEAGDGSAVARPYRMVHAAFRSGRTPIATALSRYRLYLVLWDGSKRAAQRQLHSACSRVGSSAKERASDSRH